MTAPASDRGRPQTPADSPLTMEQALSSPLYRDLVEFFVVYIREAHPEDGWVLASNRRTGVALADPTSLAERADAADGCAVHLRIAMPVLVDLLDDEVARRYGAWPDRLYLIGRDGRVAFQGDEGPSGFRPELLEAAIRAALGS